MKQKSLATFRRVIASVLSIAMILVASNIRVFASEEMSEEGDNGIVIYDSETEEISDISYEEYISQTSEVADSHMIENGNMIINEDIGSINPQAIIGENSRSRVTDTTVFPYNAICDIVAYYKDGTVAYGTGTLYCANSIITAAHVVFDKKTREWADRVEVYVGRNGYSSYIQLAQSTRMIIHKFYYNDANEEYDYAIVDLNKSFGNWIGYGYYKDINKAAGKEVSVTGYPTDEGYYYMYTAKEKIKDATDRIIRHYVDTSGGDSGAAIIDSEYGVIVGIHTTTVDSPWPWWNIGIRLNEEICNIMQAHQQELQQ